MDARLGRYQLLRSIGRGGMGEVWEAELHGPAGFRKRVALKVLRTPSAPTDALAREARLGAMLSHPNVVSTLELGEADGRWFVAMELVSGATTAALARERPLPGNVVLDIGIQVCAGLSHVHALEVDGAPARLVHCDVKPTNLLVDRSGLVKIADLGIARLAGEASAGGTPGYMAPEQLLGHPCVQSDIFALGATLYRLATGTAPFKAGTRPTRARAVLDVEERLDRPAFLAAADRAVPGLGGVLRRCLRRQPGHRWRSMAEVAGALRGIRSVAAPGPSLPDLLLRTLHEAREAEFVDSATGSPGSRTSTSLPDLPALPVEPLVGREALIAQVRAAVTAHRLVTLVGPAGVGKTRTAVHGAVASQASFPGGVLRCDLGAARSADDVILAIARALDVPLGHEEPAKQLHQIVSERPPTLLILDEAEGVREVLADLVAPWLNRSGPHLLATSRAPLALPAEHRIQVDPLTTQEAVDLFCRRAPVTVAPDGDVAALVEALDRLPLAIELAAARTRMLAPSELLGRITDRFKLLRRGRGRGAGRHSSLQAALDASWELLQPFEQDALAQLSVFERGFSFEAAEAVVNLSAWPQAPWLLDVLETLVDHSLVQAPSGGRFGLLASVREWAAARLGAGKPSAEVRHAAWFAQRGTPDALAALWSHDGATRAWELVAEAEDLVCACRRALSKGDSPIATATYLAAAEVFALQGPARPAVELGQQVVEVAGPRACEVAVALGAALHTSGRVSESLDAFRVAEAAAASPDQRATALGQAANALRLLGRTAEATAAIAGARQAAQASGAPEVIGRVRSVEGVLHAVGGRVGAALTAYREALGHFRALGDRRSTGLVQINLALLLRQEGRMDEAQKQALEAAAAFRASRNIHQEAHALSALGAILQTRRDLPAARDAYVRALRRARRAGARTMEGVVLADLGTVLYDLGEVAAGRDAIERAAHILEQTGSVAHAAHMQSLLGRLAAEQGLLEEGLQRIAAAVDLARGRDMGPYLGQFLVDLGEVQVSAGRLDEATSSLDEAEEVLVDGAPMPDTSARVWTARARIAAARGAPDLRAILATAESHLESLERPSEALDAQLRELRAALPR